MTLIALFIIVVLIIIFIVAFIKLFGSSLNIIDRRSGHKHRRKTEYQYKRKNFFLTKSEHEFYDNLMKAVGDKYYIFAQVYLPTLVDHKIKGQNWRGSFAHINRKSVDFVLCDRTYLSPKLAIELDDISHQRQDRQNRDREVERILKQAGVPLLRIENNKRFNTEKLIKKVQELVLK